MRIKEDPEMFFLNNPCPLFIDEIQKEPILLEYIKERVDKSEKRAQFILSGSQNLLLMKDVSESLAGRVSICELNGLSLREINNVEFNEHFIPSEAYISKRENKLKKYDDLWKIIHKGSYPELYKNDTKNLIDIKDNKLIKEENSENRIINLGQKTGQTERNLLNKNKQR